MLKSCYHFFMNQPPFIPRYELPLSSAAQASEYLETFGIADCSLAGWSMLSQKDIILRKSILAITDALEGTGSNERELQANFIKAGAGITYFAFGLQELNMPILQKHVLTVEVPKLQQNGHIASFEAATDSDQTLIDLLSYVEAVGPVLCTDKRSPVKIGAGCVKYLLNSQYQYEKISAN